ncbi:efflux RND transporter periplasmic adaptor subunit [Pararhizobium sp. IMCC21322]|uniref:efflux RND transporter periplasmic adaptor subunit n=1 Tax=Pararhizobium sp. IMCC21322 TaxID=3067903 RepID=UPI0027405528|nr:efflux RND transporter periplasmic adaptor subunit [Pararhizobium sp. IMCC21322]
MQQPPDHSDDLPMMVMDHTEMSPVASSGPVRRSRFRLPSRLILIPLFLVTLFAGGIVGLYFQPPGLKAFFQLVGLQPGGGSNTPIAVPVPSAQTSDPEAAKPKLVAGLGRLIPNGDVVTVALPFGAGDARISDVLVRAGDKVRKGDTIAVLDSLGQLEALVETAEANVAVHRATLDQTRDTVRASIAEAEASLQRSQAASDVARQDFERTKSLSDRGVSSQAALDLARSVMVQAEREVERNSATLSRYTSDGLDAQVDVVVAARNLDSAKAELRRSKNDLSKAMVIAPMNGTVLDVHVRAGEKSGADGVADIGDVENMTAEVEIFQNQIGLVQLGQSVQIVADAFQQSLTGVVTEIGLEVERQTVTADDPAANTDARVVEIIVQLDPASSDIAARFTNLEIVARIVVGSEN